MERAGGTKVFDEEAFQARMRFRKLRGPKSGKPGDQEEGLLQTIGWNASMWIASLPAQLSPILTWGTVREKKINETDRSD